MSTTYEKANGSRLYVRKTDPLSVEQKAALAAQVQHREREAAIIKVATIGFQTRRLPGEDAWARTPIPRKVTE